MRPAPSAISRDNPVTTLKLHYEGWLALPPAFRQKLGLSTGMALEAELVSGTIVLRPLSKGLGSAAGSTHEISGISTRGAVSDMTVRGRSRATHHRLIKSPSSQLLRLVSCPSLERRLEWLISCVGPGDRPGVSRR